MPNPILSMPNGKRLELVLTASYGDGEPKICDGTLLFSGGRGAPARPAFEWVLRSPTDESPLGDGDVEALLAAATELTTPAFGGGVTYPGRRDERRYAEVRAEAFDALKSAVATFDPPKPEERFAVERDGENWWVLDSGVRVLTVPFDLDPDELAAAMNSLVANQEEGPSV